MLLPTQPPLPLTSRPTPTPSLSITTQNAQPPLSTTSIRRKIIYLESLNINSLKALQLNPNLPSTPFSSLKSVEKCLLSFGLPRSSLGRILDMYPQLLSSDPHLHLYPIFDFLLNDVSLPFPHLSRSIIRCPRLLVSDVESQLRPNLLFLRRLGFVGKHRINSQTTLLLVSSVEHTLIPKIEFLGGLGFSLKEVGTMVVRSPSLLTYSVEKNLRPKVEFFVDEMRRDVREIKGFPQYFCFSLDGRIVPRHRVLVEHGVSMPLWDMLKLSDDEFNVRLIDMKLKVNGGGRL